MSETEAEIERQEVRDAILDAAERLLAHYGYQKMTMQDLAQEAGIGVGTTYLHFRGKADVALAVIERANERIIERLRIMAESPAPIEERLYRILVDRVMLRYEGARMVKHRLEEMTNLIHTAIREGRIRWTEREPRIIEGVLQEGERQGVFTYPGSAADTARTMVLATANLMPGCLSPAEYDDPSIVIGKTERLATLLVRAVAAKQAL